MPSTKKVTKQLRELDPRSSEFCSAATAYFRENARAHRNYGRFFIGLGLGNWACVFGDPGGLQVWWYLFGFAFASAIGWLVLVAAKRDAHALAQVDSDSDIDSRLQCLHQFVKMRPANPVSQLILERLGNSRNEA